MWSPTHVQFTVLRARNLVSKGKAGNNDVFVTIQLGKQKFQTSTIKNAHNPEWFEECELEIPSMQTVIELNLYHKAVLHDEFLGYSCIQLPDYKVYERPKSQWVSLAGRPKKPDNKYRGEIEIRLKFHVKSIEKSEVMVRKRRSGSFRNLTAAVGDKFKFIRSVSFRDKPGYNGAKTESVLQPNFGNQTIFEGFNNPEYSIPADTINLENHFPRVRNLQVGPEVTVSEDDSRCSSPVDSPTSSPVCSDSFASFDFMTHINEQPLRRSQSAPGNNKNQRPRIHMGSLNLIKTDTIDSHDSNGSILGEIREELDKISNLRLSSSVPAKSFLDDHDRPPPLAQMDEMSDLNYFSPTHSSNTSSGVTSNGFTNSECNDESTEDITGDSFVNYFQRRHSGHNDRFIFPGSDRKLRVEHSPSDSEGYEEGETSSAQSIKEQRRYSYSVGEQPVLRRRSRTERPRVPPLVKDVQARRYTVQGRPSLYVYDEAFTGLDMRRSYQAEEHVPANLMTVYRNMSKEELIKMLITFKAQLIRKDQYIKDLEKYIDDLLVRVMEHTPKILQRAQYKEL